jgi:hypothetical protein
MGVLRWSLQAQWKFTLVWTLFQSVWGVLIFVVARSVSTDFPIEAAFVAASMPFAGLLSAPIMWRALMARRQDALKRRSENGDA